MSSVPNEGALPNPTDVVSSGGWKRQLSSPSLANIFQTIAVPDGANIWRRLLAFSGPGFLIAVGYMDPGNWATDIGGGAVFNFRLLSVVLISNFLAIFLQALSAKLGIATGRDLAQACRDTYSPLVSIMLWLAAEIGIVACEIAEVLGAAIALNLLINFHTYIAGKHVWIHMPLAMGVVLTSFDVILVLGLQKRGFRWIEAIVVGLIALMMVIFGLEMLYSKPDWAAVLNGYIPHADLVTNPKMLYIALGILGATVMPHNLYLHSSIVQSRKFGHTDVEKKLAVRMAVTDSNFALTLALFVNSAILIVAAATFYRTGHHEVGAIEDAYKLLTPLLGAALATPLFGIALLASGQNATLTGTLASQIVLEGFTNFKLPPWALRAISRGLAIVPSLIAILMFGERGTGQLLILSQVVLSIQLPFAIIPLIQITSDRTKMGVFVNQKMTVITGWFVAALITGLNIYLIYATIKGGS